MGKLSRNFFCILTALIQFANAQNLLGQLGTDGIKEREATTFSLDSENATLIVSTPIQSITLDLSRRNVIRSTEQEGRKYYILPAGTDKVTIRAKGYLPLELENFNFVKKRVYDLVIFEVRAPRQSFSAAGTGNINITSVPPGAKITLAGVPGEWTTPAKLNNIFATTISLTAVKEKYDTLITSITVIQDSTINHAPLKLVPRFGFVRFQVEPGVTVTTPNLSRSYQNLQTHEFARGRQTFTLTKPRYQTLTKSVTIGSGDTVTVADTLVPNFAYFDLRDIKNSTITVDGDKAMLIYETTPGEHLLKLTNTELGTLTKKFTVAPAATRKIIATDFQDPSGLKVSSDVIAELFINGKSAALGQTNQNLLAGLYTVKLIHQDLGEEERIVQLRGGDTKEMFISMLPSQTKAYWLSILPGVSQIYTGNTSRGWIQTLLFAGGAAGSYYYYNEYNTKLKQYNSLIAEYETTMNPVVAADLNTKIENKYPAVQEAQYLQYGFFALTGAVYLWNLVDAFVKTPDYGYRQYDEQISYRIDLDQRKHLTLGMQVKF